MNNLINIGLFGLGTVGQGVLELLKVNQLAIEKRVGKSLRVKKAVVLDIKKTRSIDMSSIDVSNRAEHILNDPEIDIVLELIGGIDPAESIILSALKKGKSVVTANKALLAERAKSIFPVVYKVPGYFGFEASVGAGIPIIRMLRHGFSGDEIVEISGIMNGTANYVLTKMTMEGKDFNEILAEAQQHGYAESDPTYDIEGYDTAHKLIILMNLAFNGLFDYKKLFTEGITKITPTDIKYAQELGYKIKLLGKACRTPKGIEGRVHPSLVSNKHFLSSVNGVFNKISVTGNYIGPTIFHGLGAGSHPSAAAVVSDIIEACRFQLNGQRTPIPIFSASKKHLRTMGIVPIENIESEYYLRINIYPTLGALVQIAGVLADNQISIREVIQKGESHSVEKMECIIVLTYKSIEKNIQKARQSIDKLPFVMENIQLIRVDS